MGKTKLITEQSLNYHKKRLEKFLDKFTFDELFYRTINWWLGCIQLDPMKAGKDARALFKDLIRMAVIENKILMDEAYTLWEMIKSSDKDDQYLALTILQSHYPHLFRQVVT